MAGPNGRVALITLIVIGFRIAAAFVVSTPGYTDAYYFSSVAARLANGDGLTADFVWSPVEAGRLALPVASHLFWVPLPTVLGAIGMFVLRSADFRAAQLAIIAVSVLIPLVTVLAARRLGVGEPLALAAGAAAGLGSVFAPGFVDVDAYAPAAVLGTLFFLTYARAAGGGLRAGSLAGLLVGLLYLTRSEGALFGLALVALLRAPRSRAAGAAGVAVALAVGAAWFAREVLAGLPSDLFARTALLVRYEQFFAVAAPTWREFSSSLDVVLAAKAAALATNALTFLFAFALVLVVPLAVGLRALRDRADVRAWVSLAVLVYLVQSLVWTLHSTRGSYFHSLAAFFPFGVALAAAGSERLLRGRASGVRLGWTWGGLLLVAAVSLGAVVQWRAAFVGPDRARAAAAADIPVGRFLAIDGAAWRWISGRTAIVTPSDGLDAAACYVEAFRAEAVVLERAHFAAYDDLYAGRARPAWLGEPIVRGDIRIFPVVRRPPLACPTQ